ncbi:MAG: chemotaxis protein CheW [Gammaproteobacteria bacterium]|nr:chemotaxis protein CheW [Gammaproteobacteria bacterium]
MTLSALSDKPFELLVALEQRARTAIANREGRDKQGEDWVGVGFKLGQENFVTARSDVREILPIPNAITRVPGARPWLRGIANVRGQLITIIDLKAYLGGGASLMGRHARVLVLASRDVPTGILVDEVVGFRRFSSTDYSRETPATNIRCENYLDGCYRRDDEAWPLFSLAKLLREEQFLRPNQETGA